MGESGAKQALLDILDSRDECFDDPDDFYDTSELPLTNEDSNSIRAAQTPLIDDPGLGRALSIPGLSLATQVGERITDKREGDFLTATVPQRNEDEAATTQTYRGEDAENQMIDQYKSSNYATEAKNDNNAEFELDSNPELLSSSEPSSPVDVDREEYPLLDPAEQARILMSEELNKGKDNNESRTQPKTQNEAEFVFEKPAINVTPEMEISVLGVVSKVVPAERYILVKARGSGAERIIEPGSLVCLEDRTVIGVVWEPLGRVEQPFYSIGFNDAHDIELYQLNQQVKIYSVNAHSSYVFTGPLRNLKGNDASNLFDEEASADEVAFSDDEAEAEYKRRQRLEKRKRPPEETHNGAHDRRPGQRRSAGGRPTRRSTGNESPSSENVQLSYDDDINDELYTPLARPHGLYGSTPSVTAPRGPPRAQLGRGQGSHGHGRGEYLGRRGSDSYNRNHSLRGRPSPSHYHKQSRYSSNGNFHSSPSAYNEQEQQVHRQQPEPRVSPSTNYRSSISPSTAVSPTGYVNPTFFGNRAQVSLPNTLNVLANLQQQLSPPGSGFAGYQNTSYSSNPAQHQYHEDEEYDPTNPSML